MTKGVRFLYSKDFKEEALYDAKLDSYLLSGIVFLIVVSVITIGVTLWQIQNLESLCDETPRSSTTLYSGSTQQGHYQRWHATHGYKK